MQELVSLRDREYVLLTLISGLHWVEEVYAKSKSRMLVPKWAAEGLVIKMSEVAVVILERSCA
eukprot:scaffold30641_cov103-Cyclotella_meneghiniana.AAC.1